MQRRSLVTGALLSLSAILLAAGAIAVPASAATPNITITSAGATNGNTAELTVVANDANSLAIETMTVHLLSGTTDVYDVPMSAASTTDPADQTWTGSIAPGDVPAGTYTMTVAAADSSETDTGLLPPPGTVLAYLNTATLTASSSPISYADQTTTITGQLNGTLPGASPTGLSGVPVNLYDTTTSTSQPIATMSSTGTGAFQFTTVPNPADSYDVEVDASSSMTTANAPLSLNVVQAKTRLQSVTVTPADLSYGKTGTISGTAQYDDAGTYKALASTTVQVSAGGTQLPAVHTSPQGRFSSAIPTTAGPSWTVSVGTGSAFLVSSQSSGALSISAIPVTVRWFRAGLSSFGIINAHGCLQAPAHFTGPSAPRVEIQYSKGANGPWNELGTASLTVRGSTSCAASSEAYFTTSIPAQLASAYYRAEYLGNASFLSTVSKVVHAWKHFTEVASVSLSPRSVKRGGKITISGRLLQYVRSWRDFGGQQILIILKPKGSKTWYWIYQVAANSRGYFKKTFVDPQSATWSAEYAGDATHLASAGAAYYIPLR
jgi:hypothetical protein